MSSATALVRHGEEPPRYGVFLNPSKAAPLVLTANDAVVLAEQ
ncbi:hypothetical protein [Streptomyces misionensis]|nr:hypothetical protein [Streptomyces misionensis]